jgi:excisionase family DNA binding protein
MIRQMLVRREVERALRVSKLTVYNMIQRGDLHAVKVGTRWLFFQDEIERLQGGDPATAEQS